MLNFKLSTLFDYSPRTPPRSMSHGMVKLTASDAVSRMFSPWMLMEIKLSRKKSYKKAQHCYRMISLKHRKFESRLFMNYNFQHYKRDVALFLPWDVIQHPECDVSCIMSLQMSRSNWAQEVNIVGESLAGVVSMSSTWTTFIRNDSSQKVVPLSHMFS